MADEYIRKQDAIDALDRIFDNVPMELTTEILRLRRELRGLSPADVAPVVHGRWIEDEGEGYHGIHCSRCEFSIPYGNVMMGYNFCPNCGAKMDSEKKE